MISNSYDDWKLATPPEYDELEEIDIEIEEELPETVPYPEFVLEDLLEEDKDVYGSEI